MTHIFVNLNIGTYFCYLTHTKTSSSQIGDDAKNLLMLMYHIRPTENPASLVTYSFNAILCFM